MSRPRPSRQALFAAIALAAAAGCKRAAPGADDALPAGATPVASASPPPAYTQAPPLSPSGQAAPMSFAPIAKRADPSVVTIATLGEEIEATPFFGRVRRHETQGLGTGFLVDRDGVILTNNHVVEGANDITVKLSDDREFPAKVVGTDPRTDIAVIRIDAKGVTPLALGDSDATEVGDWVVAIGNPFGFAHTVSAGIVSAKGRSQKDGPLGGDPTGYYDYLQTDAAINPGNSGGPLLNLRGEVVGMNTAILNPKGGAQNIGFAIPINMVKQLLPMLLRDGHVTRSGLGVTVRSVRRLASDDRARIKAPEKGAVILYVQPGGPADKAGLEGGDVIVGFESEPVDGEERLQWLASIAGVGRAVTVRVLRLGKPFDLKVTLGMLAQPAVQQTP